MKEETKRILYHLIFFVSLWLILGFGFAYISNWYHQRPTSWVDEALRGMATITNISFVLSITVLIFRDIKWANAFITSLMLPMFLVSLQNFNVGELDFIHTFTVVVALIILIFNFELRWLDVIVAHVVSFSWYWLYRVIGWYHGFYFDAFFPSLFVWIINFAIVWQ